MSDQWTPSNPKEARARAKAEKAYAKAQRPWWKRKRVLIPAALVALIVIIVIATSSSSNKDDKTASGGAVSNSRNGKHPPADDVTVDTCEKGQFAPTIKVKIVNHSSKMSNYLITVGLEDGSGAKMGEANGASNNVAAGQTAMADLVGSASGDWSTCKVLQVDRLASTGG